MLGKKDILSADSVAPTAGTVQMFYLLVQFINACGRLSFTGRLSNWRGH